jgi:hypothetical protein
MMNRKGILFLLFMLCAVVLQAQSYTLIGNIQQLDADTVVLLKMGDAFEMVKVPVEEGQFRYESTIEKPYYVQVFRLNSETQEADLKLTELMVEASTIYIEGPAAHYDSIQVRGSKSDKVMKTYFKEDGKLTEKWDALKVKYDTYKAKGDTLSRKAVAKQLNEITFGQRVNLLKRYVEDNKDQVVGALLPIFCAMDDILKKEDYRAMYDMLSPEIQQTAYGKELKSRSEE